MDPDVYKNDRESSRNLFRKGEVMGRPLEILILDDESMVGQRLKPALEKEGYRVETFTAPKEAVARLEEKNFDIVVTDIRMEELDGMQVLAAFGKSRPIRRSS